MTTDTDSERQWLRQAADGDRASFEHLYRRYHTRIVGYLYRTVGNVDVAQELATDVFVEVWKKAGTFRGESKVSTWMFGIARFKALTRLRKTSVTEVDVDDAGPLADPGAQPDEALARDRVKARIAHALGQLSADHREVMELTFFQGFAYPEIAELVGCPVNTVKTRMFHARKQLRELLGAEGFP